MDRSALKSESEGSAGFYIFASRHRQAELEDFAADLQEGYSMRTDPNLRGQRGVSSAGGPTVVNITEQRQGLARASSPSG